MTTHQSSPRHEDLHSIHMTMCELAELLFLLSTSDAVRKSVGGIASAFSICAQVADRLADRLEVLVDADEGGAV